MAKFSKFDEICKFIFEKYGVKEEFPFKDDDETAVFRHKNKSKKWFVLFMRISGAKFDLKDEVLSVINLKCDPELALILHDKKTIFPAYHMNKKHWISVILNTTPKSQVEDLIEESFNLTKK